MEVSKAFVIAVAIFLFMMIMSGCSGMRVNWNSWDHVKQDLASDFSPQSFAQAWNRTTTNDPDSIIWEAYAAEALGSGDVSGLNEFSESVWTENRGSTWPQGWSSSGPGDYLFERNPHVPPQYYIRNGKLVLIPTPGQFGYEDYLRNK